MTVRLYDTRAQALRDFVPLDPSNVTMYVCGPTVQSEPGIHHVRAAVAFDVLRRWLEHDAQRRTYRELVSLGDTIERSGRVTFVRNVTDIDDKILANATSSEPWWALAYRVEQQFNAAYAAVGVKPPTYEPRATGSIPQMIEIIERLLERGHAYIADDASGDVYFDVRSWPAYGSLTNQGLDDLEQGAEPDGRGKRDPHDFALWKGAKPGEPADASWRAPWGEGRPGWHIECSAMAARYLGATFDIHGGGRDLRFPHHENELAQSTAAGDEFARYWLHNGLVNVAGQKMSKSLGNYLSAREILNRYDPMVVRYALIAPHYRSDIELSEKVWQEAQAALGRIRSFLERSKGGRWEEPSVPQAFADALNDDLATPTAVALIHDAVRRGNAGLDAGDSTAISARAEVEGMLRILGFDALFDAAASGDSDAALDTLVQKMIAERNEARASKDWSRADSIRDALASLGITLKDSGDQTTWSFDG